MLSPDGQVELGGQQLARQRRQQLICVSQVSRGLQQAYAFFTGGQPLFPQKDAGAPEQVVHDDPACFPSAVGRRRLGAIVGGAAVPEEPIAGSSRLAAALGGVVGVPRRHGRGGRRGLRGASTSCIHQA